MTQASQAVSSPRAHNVNGQLFRHSKGAVYRRLFEVEFLAPLTMGWNEPLFHALHSDDCRELLVVFHETQGVLIFDSTAKMESPGKPHVLYISLEKAVIWARPRAEFYGDVPATIEGIPVGPDASGVTPAVRRFQPLDPREWRRDWT